MRALKALIALAMLAATLLAVPAAGANGGSDEVDVIRRANGILDIIGDNRDNDVAICQAPHEEPPPDAAADGHGYDYIVVITDDLGVHYESVYDITKDVRFNMRGGDDNVRINGNGGSECENIFPDGDVAADGHVIHFPRDLRITLGSGDDSVYGYHYWVYDDMTVIGGAGFQRTILNYGYVNDRMDVNAGPGGSITQISYFEHGTTSVRGGPQSDYINLGQGYAGRAPRFLTAAGTDGFFAYEVDASGRVLANMGSGDDYFTWVGFEDCVECECDEGAPCDEHEQEFYFNIIMGAGNDETNMDIPLIPQDRLNGGSGNEDYLGFIEPEEINGDLFGGATINGYEFFGPPLGPN